MTLTFEQFVQEQIRRDPQLRRSSDVFLRQMYINHVGKEAADAAASEEGSRLETLIVTTAHRLDGFRITHTIDVIGAECVVGMGPLRDFFAAVTDVIGGRSEATQAVLRNARRTALRELRKEAASVGANAVIGVDIDYSEFTGHGKSMLLLVATGTAVIVEHITLRPNNEL